MQAGKNKVFLEVAGQTILERSLGLFQSSPSVDQLVLVVRSSEIGRCQAIGSKYPKLSRIVPGGNLRHQSEFAGIQALAAQIDGDKVQVVLVHDAVRPFASVQLVERLIAACQQSIGCIPGMTLPPTVVGVDQGWITGYPSQLVAVQTPQAFQATWLLEAHNKAAREGFVATDTASVIEWAGGDVRVIEGEADNVKITTPRDLELAERIARMR
jgi:2-C-methyl-D-erythritol 4-phosphate cytidylyltransferase